MRKQILLCSVNMESTMIEFENNSDISDVPIDIVENTKNFIDIDHFNAKTPLFSEWWPVTAKILIHGLFSTSDNQRKAAETLLPILEIFPPARPEQMRMQNEQLTLLYDLLASKLRMYEHHTTMVRERWCEAIRSFLMQARVLNTQMDQNVMSLRSRAKFHLNRTTDICNSTEKQRCWKAVAQITSRFRQQLIEKRRNALALLRYRCTDIAAIEPPQLQSLDSEIERTRASLLLTNKEAVHKIYKCYSDHLVNVQHEAAMHVAKLGSTDWIDALKAVNAS